MKQILHVLTFMLLTLTAQAQTYVQGKNFIQIPVTTATAGGTTTLTLSSDDSQQFTGTLSQNVKLPNATGIQVGRKFDFYNDSTGVVTVQYSDTTTAVTLASGARATMHLLSNATADGVWLIFGPSSVDVTLAAVGTSPNANAATLAGQVLNLQPADASNPGVISTSAQTMGAGSKTFSSQTLFSNGSLAAPGVGFSGDPATGLLGGSGTLNAVVGGVSALHMAKSTTPVGGFGNLGMGGAPSTSDTIPLLIDRTQASSGVILQVNNDSTAANSFAALELYADNANVGSVIAPYTSASTVPPYISSLVIRSAVSGHHVSIMGGENSGDDVGIWTNGDFTSAGQLANFNSDKSVSLMQAISTPTAPASGVLKFYQNSSNKLCTETSGATVSCMSGTNTGDQTITLTGGVTGSGTGSFAATVVTNANLTGPITSVGNATSVAAQTGTGSTFVMNTSPTLVTPALGTPSALVGTNITGTASGLTSGVATNIAGGAGGSIPYQTASATTAMLANGTAGQVLQSQGTTLAPIWSSAPALAVAVKTASYTTLSTDNVLLFDMSGSSNANYSVTLLTAVGNLGLVQTLTIKTGTGILSVLTTSAQTIGGIASGTLKMAAVNDTVSLVSDGSNWQFKDMTVSVAASYSNTAGTSITTSFAAIPFATKLFDPLGIFAGSTITIPLPGKYRVCAVMTAGSAAYTTTQGIAVEAVQAGSAAVTRLLGQTFGNGSNISLTAGSCADFNAIAGDTIQIQALCSTATALATNTGFNHFEIERVGN